MEANKTQIKRYVKIKAEATTYNPIHHEYLGERLRKRLLERKIQVRPKWWLLWGETLKLKDD